MIHYRSLIKLKISYLFENHFYQAHINIVCSITIKSQLNQIPNLLACSILENLCTESFSSIFINVVYYYMYHYL